MKISELYLDKIKDLYELDGEVLGEYLRGKEQLDKMLDGYEWKDINVAINRYYNRRSSVTPPKVQQIIAIAEDNGAEKWVSDYGVGKYELPRTNLAVLKEAFEKMIGIMVNCGVLPNEDGKFDAIGSLVDPANELPMLSPKQNLEWMVEDVEKENPELFEKFDYLSFWEKLAICLKNKKVKLRVRNWGGYSVNRDVM